MSDQNEQQTTKASDVDELQAIEDRLERKREEKAKAERAQRIIDLQAREKLEEEHDAISAVKVARHVAGQPTMAFIRTPSPGEYKRYRDTTAKSATSKNTKSQNDAADLLARACWVYPADRDAQDAMLEAYPGLLVSLTIAAQKLAEGNAVDEGKG